ncbi:hypothetical protein [Mucilaginibacter panaciglaebae]
MKKIALVSAIALSGLLYTSANAQILQIGLNLGGHRPMVEASLATPNVAVAYSNADDYYYLPDVDAYYSVPEKVYYYNDGVNWVPAAYLPGEYRSYDWRNARHYEVRARRPFLNAGVYRERYNGRAYDWKRYNDRSDNRYNDHRDFSNRNNNRAEEPRFVRPYNQPRGVEHADNRNWNNRNSNRGNDNSNRGNDNRNDNHSRNNNQRGDRFVDNHNQGGQRGFGKY